MFTVAKYDVVSDERVSLDAGEAHDFPLETPGIRPDIRSLLSFMFAPLSQSSVEFKMLIANSNGINEIGRRSSGVEAPGTSRVLQYVIKAGVLQTSGNTLRIEVIEGDAAFSDIMLWYQTEV